jgi:hypothetical protein
MRSRSGPCACAGGLPRSLVDPRKTSPVVSVDASLQPGKKLLLPVPGPEGAIRCADLSLHVAVQGEPLGIKAQAKDVDVDDGNRTVVGGIQIKAANTLASQGAAQRYAGPAR